MNADVTPSDFAGEAAVVINQLAPEFEYEQADLSGFVRVAWPYDGTPADAAVEFMNAVAEQRGVE